MSFLISVPDSKDMSNSIFEQFRFAVITILFPEGLSWVTHEFYPNSL